MSKLIFVCLIALVIVGVSGASNQDFEPDVDRIVGGERAKKGQFPYQIAIRSSRSVFDTEIQANVTRYFHVCGGSILNERWALSAAHCTEGRAVNRLYVVVGALHVFNDGIRYPVERFIQHPEYDSQNLFNDLSLLKTRWAIQFNVRAQPIAITRKHAGGRESATVSGWGFDEDDTYAKYLRFSKTNVLSNKDCVKRLDQERAARITNDTLCTFKSKTQGICLGDSGGPLVYNQRLIGVVSWTVLCGGTQPDVFVRVSSHVDWIVNVTAVEVPN